MAASSSSSSMASIRSWRTTFLTLRDESLTSSSSIPQLLDHLIFSHSHSLISAAPDLPPLEVSSDLLFILELVTSASEAAEDISNAFADVFHLIHDVSHRVSLEFKSSSWTFLLDSFGNMIQYLLNKVDIRGNILLLDPVLETLETIRHINTIHHQKYSVLEDIQLVKFLLRVIINSHSALFSTLVTINNSRLPVEISNRTPKQNFLSVVQTTAFSMLSQAISRVGSSMPVDVWKSIIEAYRKVMDVFTSKNFLVEDKAMLRYYLSLLHCLHLVLADPKCSLSDHGSVFVAALRMFFTYGLTSRPQQTLTVDQRAKELSLSNLEEPQKKNDTPYRPPHLRKRNSSSLKANNALNSQTSSDQESQAIDFTSSDSDYSDTDGQVKDGYSMQTAKVRVAAIICIQDLCQADPKAFTTHWTQLLPMGDVLLPRKFEATLMTCLLFDSSLKAQIASASTLTVMLDGTNFAFMQIAEYKEPNRCGSFTALSSSLGQILMQLHTGILHLIQCGTHERLLTSLFKILILLISSTPYSRMPGELLLKVMKTLQARLDGGFPFKSDHTSLSAAAVSCLAATLSTSPSSPQVREMLFREMSEGLAKAEKKSGLLLTLLKYSEQRSNPTICFEALQALRAVSHNYPHIMSAYWEQVSSIVCGFLRGPASEVFPMQWKVGESVGGVGEKVITAAVKVLDECLRAMSGFKGTGDLSDDKLLATPFTSDIKRMKKVSSAPTYDPERSEEAKSEPEASHSGCLQWCEAIEKHLSQGLFQSSAMVRAASVTCFAGLTTSVFSYLVKEKQDYIISSLVNAAVNDEVALVRSAACRAIGVISCFPEVSHSVANVEKLIHAVEINTHDSMVSVRITASWALANICDSIHHCIDNFPSEQCTDSNGNCHLLIFLIECTLRLAMDGDKIRSNAVRALGNLSRYVKYSNIPCQNGKPAGKSGLSSVRNRTEDLPSTSGSKSTDRYTLELYNPVSLEDSSWLERMVQAFISSITTGNVKVQWNVCHALSNLFLNETLRLQDMDWAPSVFSILLLLLRDSSNFKIRIQAAAALSVPASAHDYGKSFSDVVQGLEHTVENLGSEQITAPSSFKYKVALEKQLTSTLLHVLALASNTDHQSLKDFLVKKAFFLEEWFKVLCSSIGETSTQPDCDNKSTENQKREMISKALHSLIEVYTSRKRAAIAQKFENLNTTIR